MPHRFQVQGKEKLAWNGEEIVPNDERSLQQLPEGPTASLRPDGSRQPKSTRPPYSLVGGSRSPAPAARSQNNARFDPLSTNREPEKLPASDSTKSKTQESTVSSASSGDGAQANQKFSWLSRPSHAATERFNQDDDNNDSIDRDGNRPSSTPLRSAGTGTAAAAADVVTGALSPHEQQERVATALDRMGAAVVEVRDAFRRWVPHRGSSVAAERPPSSRAQNTRAVSFSAPEIMAASSNRNQTKLSGLKEAMVRVMTDLRLPLDTAKTFCEGAGGVGVAVTFSDFVSRYADASGLLKETKLSGGRRGREVWVEGSAGAWVNIPLKELTDARRVFREEAAKQEDQDQESKSDDGGDVTEVVQVGERIPCTRPETSHGRHLWSIKKVGNRHGRVVYFCRTVMPTNRVCISNPAYPRC